VAAQQDIVLVTAIFEYRNARAAMDMLKRGKEGSAELAQQPVLAALVQTLKRAQETA